MKPSPTRPRPRKKSAIPLPVASARIDAVDVARGIAITMMIAYHFCFDLTFYHWAAWAMLDDPRWIGWRSAIVTSFLFVVGVSLALRDARDHAKPGASAWFDRAFVHRWAQIAAAAALVTAGSALLFPQSFIYFGVLHFVAVALWVCRRAPRLGGWAIVLGCAMLVIGNFVSSPIFDPRTLNWIGFATTKPITEDYVPLFPWLGVVLVGCGAGALWAHRGFRLSPRTAAAWEGWPVALRRMLATMGRRSLTIYLAHQPLLLGAMAAIKAIV
ncbi:MAG: heparan-alpha-glucosaminide N-acetyltransferase [Burkholderiaceae bacterium]